jgi:hypothetical protein
VCQRAGSCEAGWVRAVVVSIGLRWVVVTQAGAEALGAVSASAESQRDEALPGRAARRQVLTIILVGFGVSGGKRNDTLVSTRGHANSPTRGSWSLVRPRSRVQKVPPRCAARRKARSAAKLRNIVKRRSGMVAMGAYGCSMQCTWS